MRITKLTRRLVGMLMASVAVLGIDAQAHSVWIAQRTGEWTLVLGDGPVDDEYKAQSVMRVQGLAKDGTVRDVRVRAQARNVALEPDREVTAIAVSFEDGYWSQTPDGKWVSGPKSKVPRAKFTGFYQMYTHTLIESLGRPSLPFGLPLEVVPLSDPMTLKKGRTLHVRVLFEGKPLAGAAVTPDYVNDSAGHSVKTDARGRASVKLRSAGLNVIRVSHKRQRIDRTEADEDGYAATLVFTLPQPKE